MITENKTTIKLNTSNLSGNGIVSVRAKKEIGSVKLHISYDGGTEYDFFSEGTGENSCQLNFRITDPAIWSVDSPNLYGFELVIGYVDGDKETVCGRFAFRTLRSDKNNIYLNDSPLYVKGYIRGATAHDHGNDAGLSVKDFYKKSISEAKKFGFNFVRFHSTVPPEEFFETADELGMLVHIEFRKPDDQYNNLEEMLFSERSLVQKEFIVQTIDELYNHPSLAEYCIGNELKTVPEEDKQALGRFIKEYDGTRLFIDSCAWGKIGRPNIDVEVQHMSYYFPFGKHADMFSNPENIHTVKDAGITVAKDVNPFNVPLIAHEVCHYTALRDFKTLKSKFEKYGKPIPWWVDEELKLIEKKGLADNYDELYKASKHFQKECWKTAFEAMRSSKILSGYHFLQLADTDVYENSNGIIDCFDDESYLDPQDFLSFTGDRVLLTELGYRAFFGGKNIDVPAVVSDYGRDGITKADFICSLFVDGKETLHREITDVELNRKGYNKFADLALTLPQVTESKQAKLRFLLLSAGKVLTENSWNIWIYPEYERLSYNDFINYQDSRINITSDIGKAIDELEKGKRVCLVYRSEWTRHVRNKSQKNPEYAFKATWNRFKPVIWDRGTNYGGLCDEELLNKFGFASGKYYDFNYDLLSEDCDKIILDDFPCKVREIISGTDKSVRDRFDAYKVGFNLPELMPDRTLRRFGYLFELSVGEGSLLVCGLNMTGLDDNSPSALSMAHFIKSYISSDEFAPENRIDLHSFKSYLMECAKSPVKERMMTQFWELDDSPVESKQYWKESRKYLLKD